MKHLLVPRLMCNKLYCEYGLNFRPSSAMKMREFLYHSYHNCDCVIAERYRSGNPMQSTTRGTGDLWTVVIC